MITIRRSEERGHADHGWLDSRHSFSFANYYDPDHMGFRTLRVINEDRVQGGAGFGRHSHRDMEIVSYVLDGSLAHRDSMGNGSKLVAGDVQRMTAGSGVQHSEMNGSDSEPVHFLQIWIEPEAPGLTPGYEEIHVSDEQKRSGLRMIASSEPEAGAVKIHQDATIFATLMEAGELRTHALNNDRHAWVQVIRGAVRVNGQELATGDAAALSSEAEVRLEADDETELLLFDLA